MSARRLFARLAIIGAAFALTHAAAAAGAGVRAPASDLLSANAPRAVMMQTPPTAVGAPRPARTDRAQAVRAARMDAVRSWGIQLQELDAVKAQAAPFDLLVVDGTAGAKGGVALSAEQIKALKSKPDGAERLVISYLSIGEAEDYREDYFNSEYMTEDAPDWLLSENERWKGNRRIRFCEEGWQRTILGDDDGRNVYNSVEPSPLYRLIENGFDGVYLDRVDVYSEVEKQCPGAAAKMVAFVARLAAHARKKNPNFIVILQNAEELLQQAAMVSTIDAVAKEDLFYGADHSQNANPAAMVRDTVRNLSLAHAAGKPVLVLDYLNDADKRAADRAKIEAQGFLPYFGPRALNRLWLQENAR